MTNSAYLMYLYIFIYVSIFVQSKWNQKKVLAMTTYSKYSIWIRSVWPRKVGSYWVARRHVRLTHISWLSQRQKWNTQMVAENRNNCIGATHRYLHTDPIERGFCCRCPLFVAYRHSNWFLLVIFIRTFDYDTIGCCVRYTVFACFQMSWYVFKFLFIFVWFFFSSSSLCCCYSFIFLGFCLSHHSKFIYYRLVGDFVVVFDGFCIFWARIEYLLFV